jgi:putative tryptophan/tyrosine transport system substrate-binding protein
MSHVVTRRWFVTRLPLALVAAPLAAEAQATVKVPRIAFLSTTASPDSPTTLAFRRGLQDLGYVEGQSIVIEWRWGGGHTERFSGYAAEVVRLNVDVIVAANDLAGRAAQQATTTIPIVVVVIGDPIGGGFAATLNRPGRNVTGLTSLSPDVAAKRLQIIKEAIPSASRIGLLVDTNDGAYRQGLNTVETAARTLSLQLIVREVKAPREIEDAFRGMVKKGADAAFLIGGTMLYANRVTVANEALRNRLPMMCGLEGAVTHGCLISYAAPLPDLFQRAAHLVDKILKGARPAELPIEQPTKFELVINLKTAKSLGLTIPPSLLLRADQLIE